MEKPVYLKSNVVPEPLFEGWYSWPHLISPATAAMSVVGRHLQIMDSYLMAPEIHAQAVKNPKMLGGPFMDYEGNRAVDVQKLKDDTLERQKDLLELAQAIKDLTAMLLEEAEGFSLADLYKKVPDILKGYVELYYDVNEQVGFRFFETLLYRSKYYNTDFQSIALYLIESDDRPFVLSTPRIDYENTVHLKIPFADPRIDELFRMTRIPNSYSYIRDLFGITGEEEKVFRTFFTEEAPQPYQKYEGDEIRSRYFGHACILVETKDVSILSDPVISYGYDADISRFTYTDLPDKIDYVLITHNHQDHILWETMLQLRHRIGTIIVPRNGTGELQDPNVRHMLNACGFDNVIELDELDIVKMKGGGKIMGLPFLGEHSDLNIRTKMCFHVDFENLSILLAADSDNFEPMVYKHVHKIIGDVDVIFLGMECDGAPLSWLYGPLLPKRLSRDKDHDRRLKGSNYYGGIALVNQFNPKELYVYAMGQEPWLNYIMTLKYTEESNPIIASNRLIKECKERGLISERLFGEKDIVYGKAYVASPALEAR